MNTLSERLRRLESMAQPVRRDEILQLDAEKPLPVPTEPIPVPRKKPIDSNRLDERLAQKVTREKDNHRKKELTRLQEHYADGIDSETSNIRKVLYTVRYVEENAYQIAALVSSVCSSEFKRNLAVSLLEGIFDEETVEDLVGVFCGLIFPHLVNEKTAEEPEGKKPSRGFSIMRRNK